MKRLSRLFIVFMAILLAPFLVNAEPPVVTLETNLKGISTRQLARASSVHVVFHHPILHLYYTDPPPVDQIINLEFLEELLETKREAISKEISEKIKDNNDDLKVDRYNIYLKDLERTVKVRTKGYIPLSSISPNGARFPDKVLVVYETETKTIDPYDEEYKDDVRSISEVANVSLPKAKEILSKIKGSGYTITKDAVSRSSKLKLMRFSTWNDKYPTVLDWKVTIEGEPDINIITGYDSRGILEIRRVPEDLRVIVKAGYFELKDEFKPKLKVDKSKQEEIDKLKKQIEDIKKAELKKNPPTKRDIRNATWKDLFFGIIKLEYFWSMSHGTGTFLGNMEFQKEGESIGFQYQRSAGHRIGFKSLRFSGTKAVILTNAHVARGALDSKMYVSEDTEHLWVVSPGAPYIRYTQASDHYGSPATVLQIDGTPVISWDFDTGILITSPVPGMDSRVAFGNSDNMKPGDKILAVGNPSLFQKYSTEGIISTSFSLLESPYAGMFLKYLSKIEYNWLKNTSMWYNATAGGGGSSGSAIWALDGSEAGKIVGLHNAGMVSNMAFSPVISNVFNIEGINETDKVIILDDKKNLLEKFTDKFPLSSAQYTMDRFDFDKLYPSLSNIQNAQRVRAPGLNAAIPINLVRRFLQERGLDFGDRLDVEYFSK